MSAEHLEGADECTVEALLSCVQDCGVPSKKTTEDWEDKFARSPSPSHRCTTVKIAPKPVENPKAVSHCNVQFPLIPLSGGVTIVSPPILSNEFVTIVTPPVLLSNELQVVLTNSIDVSSSTIHASLGSQLKCRGQREATDVCAVDSGHRDVDNKCTAVLSYGGVHISKRSLRKQVLHPKPDECFEDSGLTDSKDKDTVNLISGGGHISEQSLQKRALRPKPAVAECTDSIPSSPKAAPTQKPKRPPMPCMRPQQCSVCQKVVCNNEKLKTHMRTHTGEKPYSCPMCPEKFAASNNLNIHKRTHTGEKPYSCKVCERKFSQYQNMRTHMLTHTGERPHACKFCEKRFAHRLTLRRHLTLHTAE